MSIRTSGYYNPKEVGDELIPNSDFENGMVGWKLSGWKDHKLTTGGLECVHDGGEDYIWQDRVIEVYPDDLFVIGVSTMNVSKPVNVILRFTNKFGLVYDIPSILKTFTPENQNVDTFFFLVSVSEILNEYGGILSTTLFKGVVPYIQVAYFDGWNINDVFKISSFSMRRVNPEWLKVLPVKLYNVYEPFGGYSTGTHYGDDYFTGIFKTGEYLLNVLQVEESGGSNDLTLKVTVQSYNQVCNYWIDAVVFDDITIPAGSSIMNKAYTKIATAGLGYRQRVKVELTGSGTPGAMVFSVGVVYKQ